MSELRTIGWFGPQHSQWEWMLGHFRTVVRLTESNVEDWLGSRLKLKSQLTGESQATGEMNPSSVLLIAIESRFDPSLEMIKRLEQNAAPNDLQEKGVPWAVVLGDDWVGHRRTHPLPETLQTFYWYELYDRLLPWLIGLSHPADDVASADQSGNPNKRRVSPRVQRIIDTSVSIGSRLKDDATCLNPIRMAMVVSETATTRQLWCNAFNTQGIQYLATTPDNVDLWTTPDFIVIDLESAPLELQESRVAMGMEIPRISLVRRLSNQFPDATLLVADAFPKWETWLSLRVAGADILVAKPYQLTGVFDTLRNCS